MQIDKQDGQMRENNRQVQHNNSRHNKRHNQTRNDTIITIIKGFVIGSSMSVPGISGGTMAIILGVYGKLISSISRFTHDLRSNIIFLAKFCAGAGIGIFTLSRLIEWLLEVAPFSVSFFFLGLVFGSIPALYQKTRTKDANSWGYFLLYFVLGFIIVISIGLLPIGDTNIVAGTGNINYLMLLGTGIIVSLALVMPGISSAHMLLVLGMYDATIIAISNFDFMYVGTLGLVTLIGIFIVTKPIEWTMNNYPFQTYCVIIGFVIGSTVEIIRAKVIPAIPVTIDFSWVIQAVIIAIIMLIVGIKTVTFMSRFSND